MNYWAFDARARRTGEKIPARTSLTGAEKRRRRKGGNSEGGPGGGGIQGSMKRLAASLRQGDPSLRGHRIGKGVA